MNPHLTPEQFNDLVNKRAELAFKAAGDWEFDKPTIEIISEPCESCGA